MYQKLATFLVAYLAINHLAVAHKIMTLRRLADDPVETMMDHEMVVPNIVYQSKGATHGYPYEVWVKFEMIHDTFELYLTMNRDLLHTDYIESHMENGKMVFSRERKNCYYHGSVVGYPNWSAALSTCGGLSGAFGDFGDLKCLYHIEPVESISDEIQQAHRVYRNGTCGYKDSHQHMLEPPHNFTTPHNRVRRQSATRIVEWVIVNDFRQFVAKGRDGIRTANHAKSIVNLVDMLYSKIDIHVKLVGIETWNNRDKISASSSAETLLLNFEKYRPQLLHRFRNHDTAMLLTGIKLSGSVLGVARLGALCSKYSACVTQDFGYSQAIVGTVAAHELGHLFGMQHDNGRRCRCNGRNGQCIMAAAVSDPPSAEWSSCSIDDLVRNSNRGVDRCLYNRRLNVMFSQSSSSCGDGILEGEEECDCGSSETCDDPCCIPNTCKLIAGAVCSNQDFCCSNCQYRARGSVCRESINECDISEKCTGSSGECPSNRFLQDGTDCANGKAYCYDGMCHDLDAICAAKFLSANLTPPTGGPQECFNFNTRGDKFGNCGHNSTDFVPCDTDDVRCGQLQCQSSVSFLSNTSSDVEISSREANVQGKPVNCSSFTTQPGSDIMPGLVPNGAKCGERKVCINLQCTALGVFPCPSTNLLPCSGNGQCNNFNLCSCDDGYTGFDCNTKINETTDGPSNPHGSHTNLQGAGGSDSCVIVSATIATVAIIVVVIIAAATCIVCRGKKKTATFSCVPKSSWEDGDVGFVAKNERINFETMEGNDGVTSATFQLPPSPLPTAAYRPPPVVSQLTESQSQPPSGPPVVTTPLLYQPVSAAQNENTDEIRT